jgi:formylglycine-generating enzyme required for sulfatase activity
MNPDPIQWLNDNREWVFSGIGVVIVTALVTGAWRLLRRKRSPAAVAPPRPEERAVRTVVQAPTVAGAILTDVAAGGNISIETHLHTPADPSQPDPAALARAYLTWLYQQANTLVLAGVDPVAAANAAATLELGAVYTALLTQTPDEQALRDEARWPASAALARAGGERRLSAVAQLDRSPRLVLLGDPGGGKSTFVNFAALCLAGELLGDRPANLALLTAPLPPDESQPDKKEEPQPQPWRHGALLPVRIILRDFAARGLTDSHRKPGAESVLRFIAAELEPCGLAAYMPFLRKHLLEQGGLVLFDGLDEVPEADRRRSQIKQAVEDFAAIHQRCRILVTSRTYAYQQQEWRLAGFSASVLEPFTRPQIAAFVDRWYAHVAAVRHQDAGDAQGRAELLKRTIFGSDRLYALAERPLLLTLMASLHAWRGGALPEQRVDLYADAVSLLMERWESQRIVRNAQGEEEIIQPSLVEVLKVGRAPILAQLSRLAYEVHLHQPVLTGAADIAERDLVGALLDISQNPEVKPRLLVDYLSNRAGLLTPRGVKIYAFPHRTFQEYLAACHLTGEAFFPEQVAALARQDPNRWREVALLAGARAAGGTASAIWLLVEELCRCDPDDPAFAVADHWGALLAGQALVETANLQNVAERNRPKLERVRRGLLTVLTGAALPAVERALAGRILARLGDPRIAVRDPMQMEFCCVPAGPFVLGEGKEQYEHKLDYTYWISRYPLTNAQFQAFMDDGGYGDARWWREAQAAGYWKDGSYGSRRAPYAYGEPFNLPNHPVVGVTWYEALAFTRWLDAQYARAGFLPAGLHVHLPNEPEWEKAARGGLEIPVTAPPLTVGELRRAPAPALQPNAIPRRRYPWGDDPDAERANSEESQIGSTSATGAFAAGASPCGVEDLAGNVWEWTRSLWGKSYSSADFGYPYQPEDGRENLAAGNAMPRVIRGGAYYTGAGGVGCGVRYWSIPGIELDLWGFRVVLSPFTSGL